MTVVYPASRTENTIDILGGLRFSDPYRWLEGESIEVKGWQRAQSAIAEAYIREWPHFERLQRVTERFSTEVHFDHVQMPLFAGGNWFRTQIVKRPCRAQAIVAAGPTADGKVVFDPIAENPDKPPFLSWISPSPDGLTLALGLCADGSENNTIRLVDV